MGRGNQFQVSSFEFGVERGGWMVAGGSLVTPDGVTTNERAPAWGGGTVHHVSRFTHDASRIYCAGLSTIERRLMGLHWPRTGLMVSSQSPASAMRTRPRVTVSNLR